MNSLPRSVRPSLLFATMLVLPAFPATAQSSSASSTFQWRTVSPESHEVSSAKLEALKDDLAARRTKAFLVVHDDVILFEWYATDQTATKPHGTASMAKAIVGGLAVGVALSDGRLSLDTPVAEKLIPQWRGDPQKARITLRQLGSHTSGVADAEESGKSHNALTGWKGDFWKRLDPPNDPFTLSRDAAPVIFEPGSDRQYSNTGIAMMDYAVAAALRDAPQKDVRVLLRERIMRPMGVPDNEWSCGYGKTFVVDGLSIVGSWGGGNFSPRATAKIGRLMLRRGDWEGRQLLSAEAVREITRDAGTPGPGSIGWWNNAEGFMPALPRDAFWGAGAGGQVVLVVPSLKLVAVRNGGDIGTPADGVPGKHYNDAAIEKYFFNPLAGIFQSARSAEPTANAKR